MSSVAKKNVSIVLFFMVDMKDMPIEICIVIMIGCFSTMKIHRMRVERMNLCQSTLYGDMRY